MGVDGGKPKAFSGQDSGGQTPKSGESGEPLGATYNVGDVLSAVRGRGGIEDQNNNVCEDWNCKKCTVKGRMECNVMFVIGGFTVVA